MQLETEPRIKRSIQYYAERKAAELIAEFEYNMDIFIDNKRAKFSPIAFIKEKKASAFGVQKVVEFYSRIPKEELDGFCHPREKQFVELVLDDCTRFLDTKKKIKKTRVPKEKPADKLVAKLKYLKAHEELNLESVEPETIVKSQILVTYNVKTRKLAVYHADDVVPFTLGVSRSTIVRYSQQKSLQKVLRNPEKQIATLMSGSQTTLVNEFAKIKAKSTVPSGRINEDTILLRTFQV